MAVFRGRKTEIHMGSSLASAVGSSEESGSLECSLIGSTFLDIYIWGENISMHYLVMYAGSPRRLRLQISWDLQLRQTLQELTADLLQLVSESFSEGFSVSYHAWSEEKLHNIYLIFILNVNIWYIMYFALVLIFFKYCIKIFILDTNILGQLPPLHFVILLPALFIYHVL